jgi:protoporphyrin/coproporphyrin ferrochelatase
VYGVQYDAVVLISFGGPEGPEDVMPFLRNVVRGRGVPDERLTEVAEHYLHFGGVSPINAQCRELLAALQSELDAANLDLPLYWGQRNWAPYLADTLVQMRDDGVERALGFVLSPYGSYSSCRQYLEDIANARASVGGDAPVVDKIRHYHDDPGYVEPHVDGVRDAFEELSDVERVRLIFTAHSIPSTMEQTSGPDGGRYTAQLTETARLVADRAAPGVDWDLVWQSRSGPPSVPWLEPDINDHLTALAAQGVEGVVVSPIGFVSDHLEVLWDLDTEAAATAAKLGLRFARAATPGNDPRFIAMIRDLIRERLDPALSRPRLGTVPVWDSCPANCCPPPPKRPR